MLLVFAPEVFPSVTDIPCKDLSPNVRDAAGLDRRAALRGLAVVGTGWVFGAPTWAAVLGEADEAQNVIVPLPSVFGVGASSARNRTTDTLDRWLPALHQIGVDNHRSINAWWPTLEPQPDNWFWSGFDDQMGYLRQRGIWFGILLMGSPAWNTQDEPRTLPVNNLQGWARYVTQVAHRAKGWATHLEVWNEPPNGTGAKQTPADYARIVRTTHSAAKAVDNRFQVGLAAKSAHILYLEQVIKAGARGQFDYVVLHPYESLNGTMRSTGGDRIFASIVPTLRKMLAKMSPTRRDVPVFFTEIGATSELGERFQADALIKAYVLGLVQGVSVIQWFEGMDGDSGPLGLMDAAGNPRQAFHALAALIRYLGRTPTYQGRVALGTQVTGHVFSVNGGPVMVAWGKPMMAPQRVSLQQPSRWLQPGSAVRSAAQIVVGPSPVLVLDVADSLVAAARSGAPDPVDVEMARTDEVFIDFGTRLVEYGLYVVSAQGLDVYGGSQPRGTPDTGQVFAVDPAFLCYDAETIEITVEIERTGPRGRIALRLNYEAATPRGFKTAGGALVMAPAADTAIRSWKIKDARFVNQWGYGFALVSECQECPPGHRVKRISVRKVLA
ncbi:MAG: hypothetical protein LW854_23105 [Rubrivivax sp.]|jgi:hypothetical protein|nr:hypothetical protein [Rubrivivax sp.]